MLLVFVYIELSLILLGKKKKEKLYKINFYWIIWINILMYNNREKSIGLSSRFNLKKKNDLVLDTI